MKESDDKSISSRKIDSAEFMRLADQAMRRAQRVAEKENARYGMKLVLEPSSPPARKVAATRLRRVEKRVQPAVVG